MDAKDIRYIVMMLNPDAHQYTSSGERIDTHDGEIFSNLKDAREYALDSINSKQCTRFAIGMFVFDSQAEKMSISMVETFGFRNDKKSTDQLDLFKPLNS
jgi:hypothetical protein